MRELRLWQTVLLVGAILSLADGQSPSDESCNCFSSCPSDATSPYSSGNRYRFSYESKFESTLPDLISEKSGLQLRSSVDITALSSCEFTLRLSDVKISQLDGSASRSYLVQTRQLAANDLRFGFLNGRILSVCPKDSESQWALNIKRAILSAFQSSENAEIEETKTETDVSGSNCATNYTISERTASSITVTKRKDLTSCSQKYTTNSLPHLLQVFGEPLSALPFVRGKQQCSQVYAIVPSGLQVAQTECTETHQFLTLNNKQQGPTTEIATKLTFVESAKVGVSNIACSSTRTTLKLDVETKNSTNVRGDINAMVRSICEMRSQRSSSFDTLLRLPVAFLELQARLQTLSTQELETLWGELNTLCNSQQRIFIRKLMVDAVAMTQTDASVAFIQKLFASGDLQLKEANILLDGLYLIMNPSEDMVKNMRGLLQQAENFSIDGLSVSESNTLSTKAFLLSSTLVSRFCKQFGPRCELNDGLMKLHILFDRKLTESRQDKRQMAMVLKAIGNIGLHNLPKLENTVRSIIESKDYPIEVRLAALDTVRNVPCSYKLRSIDLAEILRRSQPLPLEMRIKTYLLLTRCPSIAMFSYVKDVILHSGDDNENSQLRSFVWTHLRNLESSQRPDVRSAWRKTFAQYGFSLAKFEAEFARKESLKLSRNLEHTFNLEGVNFGATLQSNLIWNPAASGSSQKNTSRMLPIDLPQAIGLNLTVNMFGISVNLVELESRFVNMDGFFDTLFTRVMGQFLKNDASESKASSEDEKTTLKTYANQQNIRLLEESKRENRLLSKVEQRLALNPLNPDLNTNPDDQLGFDTSLRILGYEVRYEQFLVRVADTLIGDLISKFVPATDKRTDTSADSQPRSSSSTRRESLFPNLAEVRTKLFRLIATALKSNNFQYELTKTVNLLSITQRVPTAFGAPLKLRLNTTALLDVALRGSLESGELSQSVLQTTFTPVVTLQMAAFFGLEFTSTHDFGVQTETNARSTMELDVAMQIETDQLFKFTWNVPKQKMDLFAVSSKVFLVRALTRTEAKLQSDETTIERTTCVPAPESSQLLFGMKACFAYRLPHTFTTLSSPIYPLLRSNLSVVAQKTDTHTAYTVDVDYRNDEEMKRVLFSFDMPGATVQPDRKLLLDGTLNLRQNSIKFELVSPWKRGLFEAMMNIDDLSFMRARLASSIDGTSLFNVTFENRWSRQNAAMGTRRRVDTLTPRFSLQVGSRAPVIATGLLELTSPQDSSTKLALKRASEVRADVAVDNLFKRQLFVRGVASYSERNDVPRYNVTLTFGSAWYNGRAFGFHEAHSNGGCMQDFTVEYSPVEETSTQKFSMKNTYKPGNSSFYFKSEWRANSWQRDFYAKHYSYADGRSQHQFEVRDETAATEKSYFLLAGGWNLTQSNGKLSLSGDEQLVASSRGWDYQLSTRHKQDDTTFDHRTTLRAKEQVTSLKLVYADLTNPRGVTVSSGTRIRLAGSPRRTVISDCELSSSLINARVYTRAVKTDENELALETAMRISEIGLNTEVAWYAAQTTARNGGVELQLRFVDVDNEATARANMNVALSRLLGFEQLIAVARYELTDRRSMVDVEFTRNSLKYGQLTLVVEPDLSDARFEAALALLDTFELSTALNLSRSNELLAIGHSLQYRFGAAATLHQLHSTLVRQIETDEYAQRRIRTDARVTFDSTDQVLLNYTLERKATSYVNDFTLAYRPEVLEDGLILIEWLSRNMLFALGMRSARSVQTSSPRNVAMRRINLHADYEFDDGWTRKGLSANLRIQTPFANWQDVAVRLSATGQLTAIRVDLEAAVGLKRFAFNMELDPRSVFTDNTIKLRLITPWSTLSYLNTQFRYLLTASQYRIDVLQEMNANNRLKLSLNVEDRSTRTNSESNAERKRDYTLSLDFESYLQSVSNSNWTLNTVFKHLDDMASAYETTLTSKLNSQQVIDLKLLSQVGTWISNSRIPRSLDSELRYASELSDSTFTYKLKYRPVSDSTRNAQKFKLEHSLVLSLDGQETTTTHTTDVDYRVGSSQPDFTMTVDSQLASSIDSVGTNTVRFEFQLNQDGLNLLGSLTSPVLLANSSPTSPAVRFTAQLSKNEEWSKGADGSLTWKVPFTASFQTMDVLFNYANADEGVTSRLNSRWKHTESDSEEYITVSFGIDKADSVRSFRDTLAFLDSLQDMRLNVETSFSQLSTVNLAHKYTVRRTRSSPIPQRESIVTLQVAKLASFQMRHKVEATRSGLYTLESAANVTQGRNTVAGLEYVGTLTNNSLQVTGKVQSGTSISNPFKVNLRMDDKWYNATVEYAPASTARSSRRTPQLSFLLNANYQPSKQVQFNLSSLSGSSRLLAVLNYAPSTFEQRLVITENGTTRFKLINVLANSSFLHEYENEVRPFWNYRQSKLLVRYGNLAAQTATDPNRKYSFEAEYNRRTIFAAQLTATSARDSGLQHLSLSSTIACSLRRDCTHQAAVSLRNLNNPINIGVYAKYRQNDALVELEWAQRWINETNFDFSLKSNSTLSSLINVDWFDKLFNTKLGVKWVVPRESNFSVAILAKFYNDVGLSASVDWLGTASDWLSSWTYDTTRYAATQLEISNAQVPIAFGFAIGTPNTGSQLVSGVNLRVAENQFLTRLEFDCSNIQFDWLLDTESQWWRRYSARAFSKEQSLSGMIERQSSISCDNNFVLNNSWTYYENQRSVVFKLHLPQRWPNAAQFKIEHRSSPVQPSSDSVADQQLHEFLGELLFPLTVSDFGDGVKLSGRVKTPLVHELVLNLEVLEPAQNTPFRNADLTFNWDVSSMNLQLGADQSVRFGFLFGLQRRDPLDVHSLTIKLEPLNFDYSHLIVLNEETEQAHFSTSSTTHDVLENSLTVNLKSQTRQDTKQLSLALALQRSAKTMNITAYLDKNYPNFAISTKCATDLLTHSVQLACSSNKKQCKLDWQTPYAERRLRKTGKLVSAVLSVTSDRAPRYILNASLSSIYPEINGLKGTFEVTQRTPRGDRDVHTTLDLSLTAPLFDTITIQVGIVPCERSLSFNMIASEKVPYFQGVTSFAFSLTNIALELQFRQPGILSSYDATSDQNVFETKLEWTEIGASSSLFLLPYEWQFSLDGFFMAQFKVQMQSSAERDSARRVVKIIYGEEDILELTTARTSTTLNLEYRLPSSILISDELSGTFAYVDEPNYKNQLRLRTATINLLPSSSSYSFKLETHKRLSSWMASASSSKPLGVISNAFFELGWSAPQSDSLQAAQLTLKTKVDNYVNLLFRGDYEVTQSKNFRIVSQFDITIRLPDQATYFSVNSHDQLLFDAGRKHFSRVANCSTTHNMNTSNGDFYSKLISTISRNEQSMTELTFNPTNLRLYHKTKDTANGGVLVEMLLNSTHFYANLGAVQTVLVGTYVRNNGVLSGSGTITYKGKEQATVTGEFDLQPNAQRKYNGKLLVASGRYKYADVGYSLRYDDSQTSRSRAITLTLDTTAYSSTLFTEDQKKPLGVSLRLNSNTQSSGSSNCVLNFTVNAPWQRTSTYEDFALRTTYTSSAAAGTSAALEVTVPTLGVGKVSVAKSRSLLELRANAPCGELNVGLQNEATMSAFFDLSHRDTKLVSFVTTFAVSNYATSVDLTVRQQKYLLLMFTPTFERATFTALNLTLLTGVNGWKSHELLIKVKANGETAFQLSSDAFPTLLSTTNRKLSFTSSNLQVQPVVFKIVTPFDIFPGLTIHFSTSAQQGFNIQLNVTLAKDNSVHASRIEYIRSQRFMIGFSSPHLSPLEFVFDTQRRNCAFTAVYGPRLFVLKWAFNLDTSTLEPIFEYGVTNKLWTAQDRDQFASSSCPFRQTLAVLLSNSSIRLTKTRRPTDSSYVLDASYRNGVIGTNARRTDGYALRTVLTGVPRSINISQNPLSVSLELTVAAPRTLLRRDFVSFWSVQISPELARITSRHPSVDSFRAFELSINGALKPDTQQIDQVLRVTYVPSNGNRQEETFTAMANLSMRYDERANQRVVNASFLHERSLSSDRFYLAINADYLIVNSQRIVGELEFIRNREKIKSSLELSLENFSKLRQLPNLNRNGIRKLLENRMVFLYALRTPYALVKDLSISLRNEPASSSVSILTKLVNGETPTTAEWKGALSYYFSENANRIDWLQIDLQVPSSTSKLLYRFEKLPNTFDRFSSDLVWTTDSVKQLEFNVSKQNDVVQLRMNSVLKSLEKFRTVSLSAKPYATLSRNFLQTRDDVLLRGYQFEFFAQPSVEKMTLLLAMGDRAVSSVSHSYFYMTSTSAYEGWRSVSSGGVVSTDSAYTRLGLLMRVVHNTRTLVNTNVTIAKNVPSVISFDESRSQPLFILAVQNARYPYPSAFELKLFNYFEDRARATTYFEYSAKLGYGESRESEPAYFKHAAVYYKSNVQTAFSTTGVRTTLRVLLPSTIPFGKDRVVNYFDVSKDGQSGRLRVSEKAELFAASVEPSGSFSFELRNFDVQRNVQPANLQRYSIAVEYDNQSTSGNERHLASVRVATPTDRFETHGDIRLTRFSQFGNLTVLTQSGEAAERVSSVLAKLDTSSDPHARSAEWIAQISAKLPSLNVPIAFRHALRTSPSKLVDGDMTLAYSRNVNENWRLTYMMDLRDNEWRSQADVVQEFSRTNIRVSMRSLTQSFRDLEARFTFLTSEAAKEFSTRYALDARQFRFEINLPQYRLRTVTKWAPLWSNSTNILVGGLISSDLQYDVDKTITFNITANRESSPQLITRLASRVDGGRETLWSVCTDARVVGGRSAQLRVYTERSGESSDSLGDDVLSITLKQNADNQLGVYGMWRPKALERVYEFLNEHSERARTIFNDKFKTLGAELRDDLRIKRTSLLDDYQSQLIAINQSLHSDLINPVVAELKKLSEFYEELREANQFFIRDIDSFVRASLDQVRVELEAIAQQLSSDLAELSTSASQSLLQLQDICARLCTKIEAVFQRLSDSVTNAAECLYTQGTALLQYVETRMWKLIERGLQVRIESFTDFLALAYDFVGQEMTSFIVRRATELSRTIDNLVAQSNQTAALPLQNAIDFCVQLVMPFVHSIADAMKFDADQLNFIEKNFSPHMHAFAQDMNARVESARTSLASLRVNLVPDDVIRYWNTLLFDTVSIERRLSALFTFTKSWLFDIYGLEVKLRNALRDSFDTIVSEMKAEITEQIGLLRTLKSTLLLVDKIRLRRMYSDMDGEFAFEIYLPLNLTTASLREMNVSAVVAKTMKYVVNQMVDRWSIDTYFQKVLETVLLNRIDRLTMSFERLISTIRSMQSFAYRVLFSMDDESDSSMRAVGLLASDHVVTFDGRHYDLSSRLHCNTRYLLAHHAAGNDSEFSVFATQRRSAQSVELESVSVFLSGRKYLLQVLNERSGIRVVLNSRRVSMPQFIVMDELHRQATITKSSEKIYHVTVVGLTGDAQLRVTIDVAKDIVSVTLSGNARAHGMFYNRLVGIFGFYDTELYNDAPAGQSLIDLLTTETDCGLVTANDRLAPRFDSREMRVQTMRWDKLEDAAGPRQRALCRTHFQSRQSPFHSCFRSVDPRQFYRMCLQPRDADEIERGELEDANADARRTDTLCRTAEVYSRLCFEHNVQLSIPRVCMRCANGSLKLNETTRTRPISEVRVTTPRIVFVLEESECVRSNLASEKLKLFSQQLALSLPTAPEFATIGLQGRSVSSSMPVFTEPHVHAQQSTWMKPEGVESMFSDRQAHLSSEDTTNAAITDSEDVSIIGAIDLALKQLAAFESASSRHIVIASCNAARLCGRSTAVRSRITSALRASNVQLHVITKDNLTPYRALRSGLPDTASLYSFNATHLILSTGARQRTQEVPVEDACTNAIGDTNGMFINMNLFGSGTNARRRQFFLTVAQQLSQTTRSATASSSCASPVYQCRARTNTFKSAYFTYFDESTEIRQECVRTR